MEFLVDTFEGFFLNGQQNKNSGILLRNLALTSTEGPIPVNSNHL